MKGLGRALSLLGVWLLGIAVAYLFVSAGFYSLLGGLQR
jgi:hypothetical protein